MDSLVSKCDDIAIILRRVKFFLSVGILGFLKLNPIPVSLGVDNDQSVNQVLVSINDVGEFLLFGFGVNCEPSYPDFLGLKGFFNISHIINQSISILNCVNAFA